MKKLTIGILAVLLLTAPGAVSAEELEITFHSAVASEFLAPQGAIFHDKPVTSNGLSIDFGSCQIGTTWQFGLDDDDIASNAGDAMLFSGGCSADVGKYTLGGGLLFINIADYGHLEDGIASSNISVSRKIGEVTVSLRGEYYLPAGSDAPEGGTLVYLTAKGSIPLTKALEVKLSGGVVYDVGAFGFQEGTIGKGTASLAWEMSDSFTLVPTQMTASTPIDGASDRSTEVTIGSNLSYKF